MYKMKADGVVFYDPSADDMAYQVQSPKVQYKINTAGSLTFRVLPGNVLYDGLHKLKTIVTLERDDEVIFRGRVLETVTDLYNRKEVYCEGELAYLLDSLIRPYDFKGKSAELFRKLVTMHNEQVEEYKRFEVGIITAVDDEDESEVKGEAYTDTLSEIKSLLVDVHGGYLRVRTEDGVRYLDYVDKYEQTCSQEIQFGVNLVNIENKVNVQELCTVLVPLGKAKRKGNITIEDANDGKDYIEDEEAIAKYGRIVKSYTWDDVSDPEELLKLGQEYMETMKADTTLTIAAVDLRACGADVDGIHLGDTVKLTSPPHGLDKEDVCSEIDLDIENPEKSEYTFGLPRVTLTSSSANTAKKMSSMSSSLSHQHIWLTETETALNINVEALNLIGHRTTQLEIDVDAAEAAIILKASQDSVDILEQYHNEVVLRLDAAENAITAKASNVRVEALETEITGLVKMEELEAELADVARLTGGVLVVDTAQVSSLLATTIQNVSSISGDNAWFTSLSVGGTSASWKEIEVVTGGSVSCSTATSPMFYAPGGTAISTIKYVTSASFKPETTTIKYLGS